MISRMFTLKVKTRRKGAGEPLKYMGCGDCETTSRSMTVLCSMVHLNTRSYFLLVRFFVLSSYCV
jgi:hypothetical protein